MSKANTPAEMPDETQQLNQDDTKASKNVMYTFRLPREELASLKLAAAAEGLPVSEYLRKIASVGAESSVAPQYGYSMGTAYSQTGMIATWSETNPEASASGADLTQILTEAAAEQTADKKDQKQ